LFEKHDRKDRGLLGREELVEMIKEMEARRRNKMSNDKAYAYADFILKKADRDHDGLVSRSELFSFYKEQE
jgi:Ca2+-binding EF-hand superfamily protein